jgi:hypothetical protein
MGQFLTALVLLSLTINTPATTQGDDTVIRAGLYDITSVVIMPHLEEMRRNVVHEQRCLDTGQTANIFPVLRQPAFDGCMLRDNGNHGDQISYQLVCKTDHVATGSAHVLITTETITGMLRVQMGGKNMTFTQRVTADWLGTCQE